MPPMVDAEKLKTLIRDTSLPGTCQGRQHIFIGAVLDAIDHLSVEVPDAPDVLGKLKAWLQSAAAQAREVAGRNTGLIRAHWKGRMGGLLVALMELNQLQAKKEM